MSLRLDRKLRLESPYRTRDDAGGFVESWQMEGILWASVKSNVGREAENEGLPISTVSSKITVRAAPPGAPSRPKAGQRFRDGNRIFWIHAVSEVGGQGRYLICAAREEEVST